MEMCRSKEHGVHCDRACALRLASLLSGEDRHGLDHLIGTYITMLFNFLCLKMFGDLKSLVGREDAPSQGRAVLGTRRLQTRGCFSYTKP